MAVLWLGADWPVHDLAERYLYFMHMTQHLLFTLVAAPILIAGMPPWLLRTLLRAAAGAPGVPVHDAARSSRCCSSTRCCCSRTGPTWSAASVGSELIHFSLHVLIVTSALVMWWPVMSPLPEMPALAAARADAVPVPPVARAHDPGVVPDVRPHAAVPGLRDVPADLGHRGAQRPVGRGPHHEARRRPDAVGRHRRDLLPLVQPGAARRP